MAGSVIVVDSSPEPEHVGSYTQAVPAVGYNVHDHEMEAQVQSSSSRDKGKQKAPAPVVYEISSDDSQTPPTHDEDDGDVQFTGMHILVTTTVTESTEDSKKRKREVESEPSDSPTGFGSGSGSGSGFGVASSSAGGPASYTTTATAPSNFDPTFSFASASAAPSTSTSRGTLNINATAGPSGHASASSMSWPVVKKARFETDPTAYMTPSGSTATVTTATAAAPAANVEHARPTGLVGPFGDAGISLDLLAKFGHKIPALVQYPENVPANAPRRPQGAHPPGINAHPPGPYYEGALLPPGHFYHDALNLRTPPAANADNGANAANNEANNVVNNEANNAANNAANNVNNGAADILREARWQRDHDRDAMGRLNTVAMAGGFAVVHAERVRQERLQRDLDALGMDAGYREERRRDADLARTQERLRARLREAEAQQENLRRARERAEARERDWQRVVEQDRERERELERMIERARTRRAQDDLALLDIRLVGGGRAVDLPAGLELGRGLGLGRGGGLFRRNRYGAVDLGAVDEQPPLIDFDALDDDLNLHEPVNEELEDALDVLDAAVINHGGLRHQLNNMRAELGGLDDNLHRINNGIAGIQGNLDGALGDFDGLGGGNNNNNGPYANPLFAPPVAAPPVPAGDRPAQHADAIMFNADRGADGGDNPELGDDDDDDIYAPIREVAQAPAVNPPANDATQAPAPPVADVKPVPAPPNATAAQSTQDARGVGPTPQPVAGPSGARATVTDVEAFQPIPATRPAAHPPVAGPSNAAGASGSNSTAAERPVDPIDTILASILEVVPDVLPEHAATLARTHFPSFGVMHTAEHVLGLLLENKNYPRRGKAKGKAKNKGKEEKRSLQAEKESDDDEDAGTDFLTAKMKGQPGQNYRRLAIYHLRQSFPHARASQLATAGSMRYARGHAFLAERLGPAPQAGDAHNADAGARAHRHRPRLQQARAQPYGVPVRAAPNAANNVDAQTFGAWPWPYSTLNPEMDPRIEEERVTLRGIIDKEFAKERRWVERRYGLPKSDIGTGVAVDAEGVAGGAAGPHEKTSTGKGKEKDNGKGKGKAREIALADTEDDPVEEGMGVECQCCFTEYAFSRMTQCPEAHLFCVSCISQYAAVQLGNMNPSLTCMHADGCAMPFGELELRRVLPRKLMRLYERVLSQKAVEGLEGLEACPFCEWKCVMEVSPAVDRLFRCGNVRDDDEEEDEDYEDECGVVSCRLCKKLDHTPKTCQEAEEDKHLDGQHSVEEAMTAALMRNCPKCKKAFIKEGGCNKMTCPYCGTHSCYTCRKQITGYDHFDLRPLDPGEPVALGKCRTHDTRQLEEIHANEVKAAAEKALADYKASHPEAKDGDIKVDIPEAPPAPPPRYLPRHRHPMPMLGVFGRQRAANILGGDHNLPGNAPHNGIGGAAAVAAVPAQGAARPAHHHQYPDYAQMAREHLARLAAIGGVPPQMRRFENGAGNAQPLAAAGPGPAPRAPPPQQAPNAYLQLGRRIEYPMRGEVQPPGPNRPPPQDIVMADAPPLNDHDHVPRHMRMLERIAAEAARGAARAAAAPQPQAPQPQAPAPPVPWPYVYPNMFPPRLDAPAAPRQPPPQPQPAPAPYYPMDPYDYLRHLQQDRPAPNPPPNPDAGIFEHGLARAYPRLFAQRLAGQANALAGPAYPRPPIQPQPLLVPDFIHRPAPAAFQDPIPPPAINPARAHAAGQGDMMGMDMGFGPGMDVDMGMGFVPDMRAGLNMGMHMGAEGGGNNENRPANPPQGQGDVARDASGRQIQPYY